MSKFKPVNIDLNTLECDIGNILKIGRMDAGEYMDVALGKDHTMEIFAYTNPNPIWEGRDLQYTVEIKRLGERVTLVDPCSQAYLSVLIRDLILGRM